MVVSGTQALRCAITDLTGSGLHSPEARRRRLLDQVRRWAAEGVDFVQLREKQLESGELLALAESAMAVLREQPRAGTRLLVNGRPDVAAAAGAHGVHLTSAAGELQPEQVRCIFASAGLRECLVSVSCHSPEAVARARRAGANLVLFGPVYEKRVAGKVVVEGLGLERLREACGESGELPVLALGGITQANAAECLSAGASGVAGIRLFA